jgi:CcmD family protein
MHTLHRLIRGVSPMLLTVASATAVAAQATSANAIGGLRAYWHVFIAYAVVIVLVLGWVISIARRLKDVEQRLAE